MNFLKGNALLSFLLSASILLISQVAAARMSYEFQGYENHCFYLNNNQLHNKASLYFAIYRGDDFEIDFKVYAPDQKIVIDGNNARQGDYVFTANSIGEYSFCFQNPTGNSKLLDFDLAIEGEVDGHSPLKFKDPEHLNSMEKSLSSIQKFSSQLMRDQRFFRVREGRNEAILNELTSRVHYYSISVVSIVAVMAIIQVLAIRSFFSTKSRY